MTLLGAVPALCLLLAGCGSSESTGSTETTTVTVGGRTTTAVIKNGKAATQPAGGLKPDTTPKFASPSSSSPVQGGVVQISYRNIAIDPDVLRVKVGSTVKWTNYDEGIEHNVTSEGGPQKFASKNFGEGHSFAVKLTKPGVIHYECTNHPASMNGTIEVVR
jgi:plastocyanin